MYTSPAYLVEPRIGTLWATTSHDDSSVDYKNFQSVYPWARTSSLYMKPLIWALSTRMEETRSWIVALKGLMLIHDVFCSKIPAVQRIGRLPFDLSNFIDGYSTRAWAFNAFVHAYFAYLDKRSTFVSSEMLKLPTPAKPPLYEELQRLATWQSLFDLLLQVYSRICGGIARALLRVYDSPGKKVEEARLALGILQKATTQGDDLSSFFELCSAMGVLNALSCRTIERIPEEDVRDLERKINRSVPEKENYHDYQKTIVVIKQDQHDHGKSESMRTIVTDKWEVFEEEYSPALVTNNEEKGFSHVKPPQLVCKILPD